VLDWVTKLELLRAYAERDELRWNNPKLELLSVQYHDVRPGRSLYEKLARAGRIERLLDEETVIAAMADPPESTRAYFRGTCLARWADSVVGLGITVAILFVVKDAAREVYRRLMDAVDPTLVDTAESTLRTTEGVTGVGTVRLRWVGHHLRAECEISVPAGLTVAQGHDIAVDAEHRLMHAIPRLNAATVHADPQAEAGAGHADPHAVLAPHRWTSRLRPSPH